MTLLVGPRRALLGGASSPPWTPFMLGSDLKWSLWPGVSRMDLAAGLVTSITDDVMGRIFSQAVTGSKPTFGSTAFANKPGITSDGTDDYLEYNSNPLISLPIEGRFCINQIALPADTNTRDLVAWGSVPGLARRVALRRIVDGGVNRARLVIPTSGGDVNVTNSSVNFSGLCYIRFSIGLTTSELEVNGVSSGPVAAVPLIGNTRMRLFANTADTPGTFLNTVFGGGFLTNPLSGARAASMNAFMNALITP